MNWGTPPHPASTADSARRRLRRPPGGRLSRRGFLRAAGAGAAAMAAGGALSACGTQPQGASRGEVRDRSDEDKVLNVSNWQLYVDVAEDDPNERPTVEAFTEETGVQVAYTEDVTDNDSFYAKLAPQLRAGQDTGRDIVVLTDWMASRLIRQGYAMELDKGAMANFPANLTGALRDVDFDPDRAYTAPWQSGFAGIAYNAGLVDEVATMEDLLARPDLKGRVTALTEWRDTLGLIMLQQGVDPAVSFTDAQFEAAVERLQQAVDAGQIRQFTGNEYTDGLASGDIAACVAWSGDIIQLQMDNPDLKFVAPEAGVMLWSDNMLIPARAAHKKNAELWIDHYYDPAVAAQVSAWVNYVSPVEGAREAMLELDPELADNELIFPSAQTLDTSHVFRGLSEQEEQRYGDLFNVVIGA